jgi:HD-like signal output (HDOD) protein
MDPQQIVKDALKRVTSISTLPEVTSKIISTVENPASTATQLHRIVSHDPATAPSTACPGKSGRSNAPSCCSA